MLTTISWLGGLLDFPVEDIRPYLPRISAKHVISVGFKADGSSLRYEKIELEEVKEPERYLYLKDTSGKV